MIVRHWRGLVKSDHAAEYESHLNTETFPSLTQINGFLGGGILKRPIANGVEFLVISRWTSIDAISKFAGPDTEAAVVPPKVQAMMIEYDRRARHYEFAEFKGR
jgi:heme-degrading monooxygenase HmoA